MSNAFVYTYFKSIFIGTGIKCVIIVILFPIFREINVVLKSDEFTNFV